MAAVPGDTGAEEARDGEVFLPAGFFEFFPDLVRDRARFGPLLGRIETPLFLADTAILVERYTSLREMLERLWGPSAIAYSFKTNYAVAESRVLQEEGAWAEVVSGREYRLARRLGYAGEEIVFNGPYKRDDELRNALRDGALIHVNDPPELERLLALLPPRWSGVRIGLRVAAGPGVGPSRFGFSLARGEAEAAVARVASVDGRGARRVSPPSEGRHRRFHFVSRGGARACPLHRGRDSASWREAGRFASTWAEVSPLMVRSPQPRPLGPPADRGVRAGDHRRARARACPANERPRLILEPGRYLVADAIVFVSETVRVEREDGLQLVTCDGAVSMVPLTHYCPQVVRVFSRDLEPRDGALEPSIVFGASCRENDVLYRGLLPRAATGDYLVFYAAGAYNSTLSPAFIFETPPVMFA